MSTGLPPAAINPRHVISVAACLAIAAGACVAGWVLLESNGAIDPVAASQPLQTRPYLEAIRRHLAETLPDGHWEEVRWYGTHTFPVETWGRLKYRAKNQFGATDIYDIVFIWNNGEEGIAEVLPARHTMWRTDDYADNDPPPLP